jgi:hypothetical protein
MQTTNLTSETITNHQIRGLGIEAFEHGDNAMFDLTVKAIAGDGAARQRCAEAINAAHAQDCEARS